MSALVLVLAGLFIGGFLLSFFFSGFETGSYALSAIRFQLRQAEGQTEARTLAEHLSDMPRVIATVLVGTNLGNYLLTASLVGLLAASMDAQSAEILSTLLLTPFVFVFAEVLPKELFRRHADELVYRSARLFSLSNRIFFPLTWLLGLIPELLRRVGLVRTGDQELNPSMLERLSIELTRGTETGILSKTQATMAHRVMSLGKRKLGHVLVPLAEVVTLDKTLSLEKARSRIAESAFSRVPLYDEDPANLIGFVWIYDVCFSEQGALGDFVRPVERMSVDAPIDAALLSLRSKHQAMAFVTDKRDRILGIVTIKDLVTEIVADLHDL